MTHRISPTISAAGRFIFHHDDEDDILAMAACIENQLRQPVGPLLPIDERLTQPIGSLPSIEEALVHPVRTAAERRQLRPER
jgi:hypothetical protein